MTDYNVVTVEEVTAVVVTQGEASVGVIVTAGEQGPRGADGPNAIGGFIVSLSNPAFGDILSLGDNQWVNTAATTLTDGGNF